MKNIDFYNFKTTKSIESEITLLIDGMNLKYFPFSSLQGSGEVEEVDVGEQKDERVNFLYNRDVKFYIPNYYSPTNLLVSRYLGQPVLDLEDKEGNELIHYPEDGSPATLKITQPNGGVANIPILPAHEFMKNDGFSQTSRRVLTDRLYLAACGVYPNYNYDISRFSNYDKRQHIVLSTTDSVAMRKDSVSQGYITIKNFRKMVATLRSQINPDGLDVVVTIFERSLDEKGDDINVSGLTRLNRSYSSVKTPASDFIARKSLPLAPIGEDYLSPISPENISAFDVSIQRVNEAIIGNSETLFDEFISSLNEVVDNYNQLKDTIDPLPVLLEGTGTGASASATIEGYNGQETSKIEISGVDPKKNIDGYFNGCTFQINSGVASGYMGVVVEYTKDDDNTGTIVLDKWRKLDSEYKVNTFNPTTNLFTLNVPKDSFDYTGYYIRVNKGPGNGQVRRIAGYLHNPTPPGPDPDPTKRVVSINAAWETGTGTTGIPDTTSYYELIRIPELSDDSYNFEIRKNAAPYVDPLSDVKDFPVIISNVRKLLKVYPYAKIDYTRGASTLR